MTEIRQTPPRLVRGKADSSLRERLERRQLEIVEWLRENAPNVDVEQKHLDAESAERAYWHYGYAAALKDIQNCLPGKKDPVN